MSADYQPFSQKQRQINPNSLANLNKFVPGQSGNPGGVRKGTVFISECYKRLSSLPLAELEVYEPVNVAEAIALRQVKDALGKTKEVEALPAVKEITDRTEGKAPQRIEVSAEVTVTIAQISEFRAYILRAVDGAEDKRLAIAELLALPEAEFVQAISAGV
jgi:hypothetical protein